jgi:RimJ/RimL family protein N-acetyltransferase
MLRVHRHPDAGTLLARAESWLLESDIERAGALQSARNARGNDMYYQRPMYWATIEDDTSILGCAFRTPPYLVGITALPEAAVAPLVADLAEVYEQVSGFSGPEQTATALAKAWAALRGGSYRLASRQRLFVLRAGPAPRPAPGVLRLAGRDDAGLAQSWGAALALDSPGTPFDGKFCTQLALAKRLYFWVDDQPRCMIGLARESDESAAVGLVYTPAAYRGKGYATIALTALQRLFVERGVRRAYFYVDPTNDAVVGVASARGGRLGHDEVDIECRATSAT